MEGREILADHLSSSNVTCVEKNGCLRSESSERPSPPPNEAPSQMALKAKSKYLKTLKASKLRRARPTEAAAQPNGATGAVTARPKVKMFKKFKDFFSSTSLKKTLNVLYKSKSRSKLPVKSVPVKVRTGKKAQQFFQNADSCDEPLNTEASSDTKQFDVDDESREAGQVGSRHAYFTHESKNLVYQDEYIPPKDYGADKPVLAEYSENAAYNGIYDENAIFNNEIGKSKHLKT